MTPRARLRVSHLTHTKCETESRAHRRAALAVRLWLVRLSRVHLWQACIDEWLMSKGRPAPAPGKVVRGLASCPLCKVVPIEVPEPTPLKISSSRTTSSARAPGAGMSGDWRREARLPNQVSPSPPTSPPTREIVQA